MVYFYPIMEVRVRSNLAGILLINCGQDASWTSAYPAIGCPEFPHEVMSSSMPPMEVLYRIRRQRPDIFGRLEGDSTRLYRVFKD